MNANALHPGHDYAYVTFPRKNRRYRPEAKRVKVLHVYKLDDQYSTKKKSFVEVVPLDDDGNRLVDQFGQELPIKTITARQLYTTWEEHLIERGKYRQETEARRIFQRKLDDEAEQRRQEYEERMRQERVADERRKERLLAKFESIGIPRELVRIDSWSIRIDRHQLERRLQDLNGEQSIESGASSVSISNTPDVPQ